MHTIETTFDATSTRAAFLDLPNTNIATTLRGDLAGNTAGRP